MGEQLTPEQERAVRSVYSFAAEKMKLGYSDYRVEQELIKQGLDEASARVVIGQLSKARSKALNSAAVQDMALGAIIAIVGLVITIGTYSAAQGGGTYVVAWGAIIFGGIRFFRGLMRMGG